MDVASYRDRGQPSKMLFLGELSVEFSNKIKAESEKQVSKDPWKETFFEDVWGFS